MQYIKPPSHYRILKGLVLAAKRLGEPMSKEDIRRRRIEGVHIHRATMIKAGDTAMQVYAPDWVPTEKHPRLLSARTVRWI